MLIWIKKNWTIVITFLVAGVLAFYCFACEPKVKSLTEHNHAVNRQELQLELDTIIMTARIRLADLDKQEQLRAIILQNALILVQGQPLNPLGIITGLAGIYGVAQGSRNVTQVVKTKIKKRKVENGQA